MRRAGDLADRERTHSPLVMLASWKWTVANQWDCRRRWQLGTLLLLPANAAIMKQAASRAVHRCSFSGVHIVEGLAGARASTAKGGCGDARDACGKGRG